MKLKLVEKKLLLEDMKHLLEENRLLLEENKLLLEENKLLLVKKLLVVKVVVERMMTVLPMLKICLERVMRISSKDVYKI